MAMPAAVSRAAMPARWQDFLQLLKPRQCAHALKPAEAALTHPVGTPHSIVRRVGAGNPQVWSSKSQTLYIELACR